MTPFSELEWNDAAVDNSECEEITVAVRFSIRALAKHDKD